MLYCHISGHKRLYLMKSSLGVLHTVNSLMAVYQQFTRLQLHSGLNL